MRVQATVDVDLQDIEPWELFEAARVGCGRYPELRWMAEDCAEDLFTDGMKEELETLQRHVNGLVERMEEGLD